MTSANNSKIHILQGSNQPVKSSDTSFECDLCNRTFTKMAFYKSHYFNVHKKCIVVMPITEEIKTESEEGNKSKKKKENKTKNKGGNKINVKGEVCVTFRSKDQDEIFNVKKKLKKDSYNCESCNEKFDTFSDLENHSKSHLQQPKNKEGESSTAEKKSIICLECGEGFDLESAYNTHKLVHTLKCDNCDELFDPLELNFLEKHTCSAEVYDILSECDICKKVYKNSSLLKVHRRKKHGIYDSFATYQKNKPK